MDNLSNKELRLLIEVIEDNYKELTGKRCSTDYIQYSISVLTGLHIAKSKIENVKPFKLIVKKSLIHKGKVIKIIRKRNRH